MVKLLFWVRVSVRVRDRTSMLAIAPLKLHVSGIHSFKLYKIADKMLLSNVNRKKQTMNNEKL